MAKDGQQEYRNSDILVDYVVDLLAQKWTRSMILHEIQVTLDKEVKLSTVITLISSAKKRIVKRYHISPEEYKGEQVAFYEAIIRGKTNSANGLPSKISERLTAAERLDKLLNLEHISNDDPADKAAKVREFLRAADATVSRKPDESNNKSSSKPREDVNKRLAKGQNDERSKDAGQCEVTQVSSNTRDNSSSNGTTQATHDATASKTDTSRDASTESKPKSKSKQKQARPIPEDPIIEVNPDIASKRDRLLDKAEALSDEILKELGMDE